MSGRKKKLSIIFFIFILTSIFMTFLSMPPIHSIGSRVPIGRQRNITILLWYWPFRIPYSLAGDVCLEAYGICGCHLVDNQTFYYDADFVVFHNHELKTRYPKLPLHLPRPAAQMWVWLSLESPQHNGNLTQYAGIFNLTMTYSPHADITVPYGKFVPKEKSSNMSPGDVIISSNKSHLACWVVSNYQHWHRRSTVYKQLKKVIPVQVYGRATGRPLEKQALLPIISDCYFYLAFENSEFPHYITEKLWRNAFQAGTVPVVLGPPRSDYEAVAPPNSFIHVDDFDSVDALGKFLKELAQDEKRYKSYFAWHQDKNVKRYMDWRERLCDICLVYDKLPYHKIYEDLGEWERR